ncbi:thiol-disulfide oxidoreductase DCC family protein [Salinicola halimionae]|uniref:thiol-disulfide oxidoreductase DCC family protein n=1 Tax=Salinicola halimionae TaxID=1949081 RepID=UPI0013006AE6|nr:DCC1-like thiol-disulfide oxidoreductase family protein [Salinicola halimionae]
MNSAPPITSESIGNEPGGREPVSKGFGDGLLLFDADCPFCRHSVRWLLGHERRDSQLRIAGLKSPVSRRLGEHFGLDFAGTDSIWFIAGGELSRNSDAAWRLATRLEGSWRHISALRKVPRPLRESGYRFVGDHRHRLAFAGGERLEDHERWLESLTSELCRRCGLPPELGDES